jgi:hypothetical protein
MKRLLNWTRRRLARIRFALALRLRRPTLHYTRCRGYYYVTWSRWLGIHGTADRWLSVRTFGETEDPAINQFSIPVDFRDGLAAPVRRRLALPFVFWTFPAASSERPGARDDVLVRDYLALMAALRHPKEER